MLLMQWALQLRAVTPEVAQSGFSVWVVSVGMSAMVVMAAQEGLRDLQEREERRKLVSLSYPLRSLTSQCLLPAFLVHFSGGERVGDGLGGGCCVEGSLGSEDCHLQKAVCVKTGIQLRQRLLHLEISVVVVKERWQESTNS